MENVGGSRHVDGETLLAYVTGSVDEHLGDELRSLNHTAQTPANLADPGFQHRVAYRRLGPHRLEERLFGYQLPGVCHQVGKHLEDFRAQRDYLVASPQAGISEIDSERLENPLGGWET
jgi:hypothetical protein